MTFKALLATKTGEHPSTQIVDFNESDLMPGEVSIAVDYSTVNYKDALAVSGRAEIIRVPSLIPGIDLAGAVDASSHPGIAVGDKVVVKLWGANAPPKAKPVTKVQIETLPCVLALIHV